MSDIVWETFDGLFKTLHRQGRRVEELEAHVAELERRLPGRDAAPAAEATTDVPAQVFAGTPEHAPTGAH